MKITKKLEVELIQLIETYWDSYAKGDLQTWASFLPDNYRNIGTTQEEIWNSKEEIVNYTKVVIDQMVGNFEFRRAQFQIIPFDPNIMIHEFGDIYVRIKDEWAFYSKIRMSSLLQKDKTGWKIIHQHGSYPDSKTVQGEAFAFDTIKAENTKLREAVKHRTIELEQKNRELEIETALEKVRSSALTMKEPTDMLDVCRIISDQLQLLGVKDIRNVQTAIINEQKGTYLNYQFFTAYNKEIVEDTEYNKHPKVFEFVQEIKRSENSTFNGSFEGEELNGFREYRKKDNQFPDPLLDEATSMHYYFYSIGSGGLGLSTYKSLNDDALVIFKRFHNVFTLAYRRFVDIEKAIAQAREARIEAALERVRARTMAMQRSEELPETTFLLFQQLKELGESAEQISIGIIKEEEGVVDLSATVYGDPLFQTYTFSISEPYLIKKVVLGWKEKKKSLVLEIKGQDLIDYNIWRNKLLGKNLYDYTNHKDKWIVNVAFFSKGFISFSSNHSVPTETIQLLERFAGVFDGTYTRFFDLQKAEAQVREAKIEAALERVRSRTMGMQKSEELKDVIRVVYEQFVHLKINVDHAGFVVDYKPKGDWHFWIADEQDIPSKITHPYFESVWANQFNEAKEKAADFFTTNLNFEEKNKFYNELLSFVPGLPEASKDFYLTCPGLAISTALLENVSLYIENFSGIPYSDEENKILMRFGKVFQQTYTRFLDLQKAETQARENQIQLALERVRARTMAMHESNELAETAAVVFKQLMNLGIEPNRIYIGIIKDVKGMGEFWITDEDGSKVSSGFTANLNENVSFLKMYNGWKEQKKSITIDMLGEELQEYFKHLTRLSVPFKGGLSQKRRVQNIAYFSHGFIGIASPDLQPKETVTLLERFAAVFNLTYRRFLDLQKAEAQAREAKIETALERTRTQSMIMQHSKELDDTLRVFHEQVLLLGVNSEFSFLWLPDEEKDRHIFWAAWGEDKNDSTVFKSKSINYPLDRNEPATAQCIIDWKGKEPVVSYHVPPAGVESYFAAWQELIAGVEQLSPEYFSDGLYYVEAFMKYGCFGVMIKSELSEEEKKILYRFTIEFERAYTRFLDLQKAEAQAREAQIEAALEKVRTVALSLKKSDELLDIAQELYEQLIELGFSNIRNAIIDIHNDNNKTFLDYDYSNDMGRTVTLMSYYDDPIIEKQVREIESGSDAFFELILEGQDLQDLIDIRLKNGEKEDPRLRQIEQLTYNLYSFGNGAIGISNFGLLSDEQKIVLKRFRNVFAFAYKRYTDMLIAETQAREAKKQASLDRIRAEIASMRTSQDLNHITPIIWRELKNLEVPFIRCGVFIVDEDKEYVHVYLTTPDGKSLAALNLSFNANELTSNTVDHWRKKQVFKEHWAKKEFINWTKSMIDLGQVEKSETYQGSSTPPETLDLHFIPFAQGMLYVGDVSPLTDDKLSLVKSLAEAFSIAYSRYEDFKNLEDAKNRIEVTLTELKSAQAQLVQAEKLASLGQLTAGIAHEIKNPLNFVNNFSEISSELLEEMKVELHNDNIDEAIAIAEDIKHNLEKINHHGKRADSIVKGMLLHSRGSAGEKSLTNLNELLDQYVNLAYHGLRAQDKEFNITILKDFDETLEKINVVPQDISRVFLNIVNNGFYAANEKKKKSENDFAPILKVSTKNLADKVEIRIRDNGNGIPQSIKNNIFNPFFTTKPTGEGTGLGLSLSYDIITKVHNGEIIFDTKENEFTECIITIPRT